jgi:hypothetical protein
MRNGKKIVVDGEIPDAVMRNDGRNKRVHPIIVNSFFAHDFDDAKPSTLCLYGVTIDGRIVLLFIHPNAIIIVSTTEIARFLTALLVTGRIFKILGWIGKS